MQPTIKAFFDSDTGTISYVVYDHAAGHAAVIDPVLDYDPKSGRASTQGADVLLAFIAEHSLTVEWILETHAHADHLSAAFYIQKKVGAKIAIGEHIREVQQVFKNTFNLDDRFKCDGAQFDYLFKENEVFNIGQLTAKALFVPGHTPADMAYLIDDALFVGDTLFMPDVGTARCDFPGGNAHTLYQSVQKILALPEHTRLFMCHDYPPNERAPIWETTVAEQKLSNVHIRMGIDEASFVAMRQARDATLDMPRLIYPSIQVNIRAGQLPPAESNGVSYLKIPVQLV